MRYRLAALEAWVSIIGNFLLAAVTFYFARRLGSIALLAQSSHTASDVITSVVVLAGFQVAKAPADADHPFGHGRAESLATLVIALMLGTVGLGFAREAISRLIRPVPVDGSWVVVAFMVFVSASKELMCRWAADIGRRIDSSTVTADAWHHRADALSSLLAASAIAGASMGWSALDGLFGLVISVIILRTAVGLARDACSALLGRKANPKIVSQIEQLVRQVPGVREIHKVAVHDYGARIVISLHILVDPALSTASAHQIAEQVEGTVWRDLAAETTVHIEPNVPALSRAQPS